jgi:hypothetical protein
MAFTDTGISSSGLIYDVNEKSRLEDFAKTFNAIAQNTDNEERKQKDVKRYAVIGIGAVVVLLLLAVAIRKKR